jgi:folate-dependent phosphoribosylglycinamide formyltransferase PurN
MVKVLGIVDSNNKELIFAIEKYFMAKNIKVKVVSSDFDMSEFDLVVLTGFEKVVPIKQDNILNIYPTLLPAFKDEENPILASYLAGVKVSGITIYNVSNDKILAQYPMLIGLDTSLKDLSSEILKIAQKIYPVVIDAVLNDKVFDFNDLFNTSSCGGSCGGCNGCH